VEACILLGSFLPAVMILDERTPHVDGPAILHFLQHSERYRRIHVLVVADGDAQADAFTRSVGEAPVRFVRRPLGDGNLVAALREAQRDIDGAPSTGRDEPEPTPEARFAEAPPDGDDAPVLDRDHLERMAGGDLELMRTFARAARDELQQQYEALDEAVRNGTIESVRHQAHTLKGIAANSGGEQVRWLTLGIEEDAEKRSDMPGRARLDELAAAVRRLRDALTTLCDLPDS
jgi:HPt (histidine-containing phosphotransfer) domain-containing protein